MKTAAATLGILACSTNVARAADAYGWRDGCPSGNLQTKSDLSYFGAGAPQPERAASTDPDETGPVPDTASMLVPLRLLLAPEFLHFASAGDSQDRWGNRTRLAGNTFQLQATLPYLPDHWGLAVSATGAYLRVLGGDVDHDGQPTLTPRQWSNVVVAVSIQRRWTSMVEVPLSERERSTGGKSAPPGLAGRRNAFSVQLLVTPEDGLSDLSASMILMQRTAFDGALFAPRRIFGGAFETRTEGVGCYAPFLHLRLSVLFGNDADRTGHMFLLPQTLAAGMTVTPGLTVMAQYGVLFTLATGQASRSPLGSNLIQRFRLGSEHTWSLRSEYSRWGRLSLGFHFDAFLGSSFSEGTAFELYAAWMPRVLHR